MNRQARAGPFSIRVMNGPADKGLPFTYAAAGPPVSASGAADGLSMPGKQENQKAE